MSGQARSVRDFIGAGAYFRRWLESGGADRLATLRDAFERDPRHGCERIYEKRGDGARVFVRFAPQSAENGGKGAA